MQPENATEFTIPIILARIVIAMVLGGLIGYERQMRHKAIGVAGLMLVAFGSTTFMMLAKQESHNDPAAISRTIQGLLQGIGFLGGAVIFKGGTNVRGIKTAAAIWITGAIGLCVGTGLWWLGMLVGAITVVVLFISDMLTPMQRPEEEKADPRPPV